MIAKPAFGHDLSGFNRTTRQQKEANPLPKVYRPPQIMIDLVVKVLGHMVGDWTGYGNVSLCAVLSVDS